MGRNAALSKSKYCKGIQCPKILWMDANKPEVAEDVLPENVLANGTKVGELAQGYFGACAVVEYSTNKTQMVTETERLMHTDARNIAEASFVYDNLYCAVDILHRNADGWDIVEVKSSTEVSDIYLEDMAFQYYVLKNSGVNVKRVCNLHINSEYERHGALDLGGLFALEDCTEEAQERFSSIPGRIAAIRKYIDTETEPVKDIDCYCEKPYPCAYRAYCGRHVPEHSVFDLARMRTKKKYELYHRGIISYADVLKHTDEINEKQKRQVESLLYQKPDEYDVAEIKAFLATLQYPIYHLDFETFQQAVPEYDGCHPYEQIPFQYSLHIEHEDGHLEHLEFLAKEGRDPRRELAERLVRDIPADACVTAYNMSFEKTVLRHLAETFSDLAEHLMSLHDHMHDLMVPFQKQHYYSKEMQGSYSIKYVLPALWPGDPELDYHNLEGVHNGAEASASFADMVNHTPEEIAVMREQLLKYCHLDTYAMVKVLRKLKEVASNG